MRNWKVVVGLTLCCALCSTAWADTKVTAAEAQQVAAPWGNRHAQLEVLRSMTAVQRTSNANPFVGATMDGGAPLKAQALRQGEGDFRDETPGGTRVGILNNTCSTAVQVNCDSTTEVSFQTPYSEDGERRPSCAGNFAFYNSVWVKISSPVQTGAKIDVCLPATALLDDSLVSVYRATNQASACTTLVELTCKDDTPGCGDDESSPELLVGPLNANEVYYIQVGVLGYGGGACGGASPCTNGDYFLRIDCDPNYIPCQIVTTGVQPENELEGCSEDLRLNDGCNADPVGFGAIACGEARTGNVSYDGETRDTDWYRLVLNDPAQTYPVTITMQVKAEFVPDMFIIKKGPTGDGCDDLDIVAANNPAGYVICSTTASLSYQASGPGEYWLFVGPNFCFGAVDCSRDYVLTVTSNPCFPAVGACCTGTACVVVPREECNPATSVYHGDGTQCLAGQCYACPAGATTEPEAAYVCPGHGYADSFNSGCGFTNPNDPKFWPSAIPTLSANYSAGYCGVSGTHFNAAPPAQTQNARDNDWYRWNLTGASNPNWYRIKVKIQSEFKAQLLIVNPDLGTTACSTFASRIVLDTVIEPGPAVERSICVLKRTGVAFLGDVWVIVRPYKRGTPYEIPCGVRYWYQIKQEACSDPGACCTINGSGASQGCQQLSALACASAGGVYYGEGTPCSAICCPCPVGATPENESNCGDPNDNTNGGCNSDDFGYPFNTTGLDQSGDAVCGTTKVFPTATTTTRDTDWYRYNHTGGDIVYTLTSSDFVPLGFIIQPGAGADLPTQCSGLSVLASATGTACEPLVITASGAPAGTYWLWAGTVFETPTTSACGRSYYAQVSSSGGGGGGTVGRCCVPPGDPNSLYSGCVPLSQAACLAAGGTWGGAGTDCDPNPCPDCPLAACAAPQEQENEPACGLPDDITNGGCNSTPIIFSNVLNISGDEVCGTVQFDGSTRDTDWYEYNHTGGDLIWFAAGEFFGAAFLVGPVYNPNDKCCASYDTYAFEFPADCGYYGAYVSNLPAGQYQLIIVPSFDYGNIACGSKYRLQAASGVPGACCFEGDCFITYEDICVPGGGTWQGDGSDCDPSPCAATGACCIGTSCSITTQAACTGTWQGANTTCSPNPCAPPTGACCVNGVCSITTQAACTGSWLGAGTTCTPNNCPQPPTGACCVGAVCSITTQAACTGSWQGAGTTCSPNPCVCLGDADCDGDVDFFDIDPFVAKLGCPGNPGCNAPCPWQNSDVDQDGDVDFFDIDPFVAQLGSFCN